MSLRIEYKMPTPSEWHYLRSLSEWKIFSKKTFSEAAKHSVYGVCVYDQNKIVGMGRIVGDGIICFYIQDVFVTKEYRNKHIGTLIMQHLLKYIKSCGEKGATIALFSHIGTEQFYEQFGFLVREKTGKGSGMYLPFSKLEEFIYE